VEEDEEVRPNTPIAELIAEHRRIEVELDALGQALATGKIDFLAFQRCRVLLRDHYPREQEVLAAIHPAAARKIAGQQAEALELAESVEVGARDAVSLVRRFVAIAQHTIIEEERDVFPLAG